MSERRGRERERERERERVQPDLIFYTKFFHIFSQRPARGKGLMLIDHADGRGTEAKGGQG
jgi:hypothetical protein